MQTRSQAQLKSQEYEAAETLVAMMRADSSQWHKLPLKKRPASIPDKPTRIPRPASKK